MYNNDDKRTSYNREVNQVPNQNNYTEGSRKTETVNHVHPEEYRDGYVHGRVAENRYNENRQVVRDNNNAARGLILGIVLTSLVAIPALAYYLWNRQNQEPVVAPNPTPAPTVVVPSPQPDRTIIQRERVIERNPNPEVRVLPIPQGQTPANPAPNINIEQPAPAPQPTPNVNITQPTPNVNITVPPAREQQESRDTSEPTTNQQTENQLPSAQDSSSPEGTSNSNTGDQNNTATPGNAGTSDSSPAEQ